VNNQNLLLNSIGALVIEIINSFIDIKLFQIKTCNQFPNNKPLIPV
jgi:hypothetical protein